MVKAMYKPLHSLMIKSLKDPDSIIKHLSDQSILLQDESEYSEIKENLQSLLKKYFKSVKVHFYGSRIIGLATEESDLDIFVEIDENFYAPKDHEHNQQVIRQVAKILRENGNDKWQVTVCIDTAQVPVIQAKYLPTNIQCDITVSNGFGVKNTLMMQYLFALQPMAVKLFHFLKLILPTVDKDLDGYLLKVMVIVHLQSLNLLPSVKAVQENSEARETIDGCPVQLKPLRNSYKPTEMEDYKYYIPLFFKFYGNYWRIYSAHTGEKKKRKKFKLKNLISDETPFCIIGLMDQKSNVGKRVTRERYKFIRGSCASVYDGLLSKARYSW